VYQVENRRELADCLRRRLVTWMEGFEARALPTPVYEWFRDMAVDASDEELITAHLICEDCGEQLITLEEVDAILGELRPSSVDQFLDLVYHFGRHSPKSSYRANKLLSLWRR
jgi:hypothetical protein